MSSQQSTRVYVGDLGSRCSKPELEREFERYCTLKSVWVVYLYVHVHVQNFHENAV